MTSCIKRYKNLTTQDDEYLKDINILTRNLVLAALKEEKTIIVKPLLKSVQIVPIPIPFLQAYIDPPIEPQPSDSPSNSPPDSPPDSPSNSPPKSPPSPSPIPIPTLSLNPIPIPIPIIPLQKTTQIINNYNPGMYTGGVQILKNQRYRVNTPSVPR